VAFIGNPYLQIIDCTTHGIDLSGEIIELTELFFDLFLLFRDLTTLRIELMHLFDA
jgi:hypothetical protein